MDKDGHIGVVSNTIQPINKGDTTPNTARKHETINELA